jgi:hypothetical protein
LALGERQSKKTFAGIDFGMGMSSIESDWDSKWGAAVDVRPDRSMTSGVAKHSTGRR